MFWWLPLGVLPAVFSDEPYLRDTRNNKEQLANGGDHPKIRNLNSIVDGSTARPGEFPWFATLLDTPQSQPYCGGTLVSPTRILTAAHCVVGDGPIFVRVGQLTQVDGEVIEVDCVSIHPDYGEGNVIDCILGKNCQLWNDVAVLKLSEPARTVISFVTLNNNTSYPSVAGQELTVVGFGFNNAILGLLDALLYMVLRAHVLDKPFDLQKVTTKFVPEASCQEKWECTNPQYHTCASVENNGVCIGDSGGPLLDSDHLQVGVVSFNAWPNSGCGSSFPDVFANVAQYYDWIQSEIVSETCPEFEERFQKPSCAAGSIGAFLDTVIDTVVDCFNGV